MKYAKGARRIQKMKKEVPHKNDGKDIDKTVAEETKRHHEYFVRERHEYRKEESGEKRREGVPFPHMPYPAERRAVPCVMRKLMPQLPHKKSNGVGESHADAHDENEKPKIKPRFQKNRQKSNCRHRYHKIQLTDDGNDK